MKRRKPRLRDPLNLTLSGLPELDLFPDDEARERALRELSDGTSDPRSLATGVVIAVAAMLVVSLAARWLLFRLLALMPQFQHRILLNSRRLR